MSAVYTKQFKAVFLCCHPKGPNISVRSTAKYMHKSREFINKRVQRYKDSKNINDLLDRGSKRAKCGIFERVRDSVKRRCQACVEMEGGHVENLL
ncbi:hypothetical protein ANTPLA_LOCUS1927 [Anthophora plagiata]